MCLPLLFPSFYVPFRAIFLIECSFREYLPLENVISVWRSYNEHAPRVMEAREIDLTQRILQNMWQKQPVFSEYPRVPYFLDFLKVGGSHMTNSHQWCLSRNKNKWKSELGGQCLSVSNATDRSNMRIESVMGFSNRGAISTMREQFLYRSSLNQQ